MTALACDSNISSLPAGMNTIAQTSTSTSVLQGKMIDVELDVSTAWIARMELGLEKEEVRYWY